MAEIGEFPGQLLDDLSVYGIVDARAHLYITDIEANLPRVRRRNHNIAPDQFAPVHVVAKRRREQTNPVASLTKYLIRLLEYCNARPFQVPRVDRNVLFLNHDFQPVVEAPNHNRAHRSHRGYVFSFLLAPLQPAFYRFSDRDALRQAERNCRVDADATISGFLNRWNSSASDRDLYDHVRGEPVEFFGLLHDGFRVSKQSGVGLYGQPAVPAFVRIEGWPQQTSRLD